MAIIQQHNSNQLATTFKKFSKSLLTALLLGCVSGLACWVIQLPLPIVPTNVDRFTKIYYTFLPFLNRCLESHPSDWKLYFARAKAYDCIGCNQLALEDYNRAHSLAPLKIIVLMRRAPLLFHMVCYRAALFDANKIIKYQDAPAADWYSTRSFTLSKLGKYKQALADANRAIELQPQNARAYIARAYAHLGLKEILNALTDCNTARSISPSLQGLELCYAQIFSEEHNWLAAVDATSKVLVAQPDKVKARYLRAAAYSELGHFTQAADDATIAILQNPAALHAYITRAQAYYHSGKFQSALYDAQEAINIRPNLAKSKELSFVADLKHKIGSLHNTSCSSASDGPK